MLAGLGIVGIGWKIWGWIEYPGLLGDQSLPQLDLSFLLGKCLINIWANVLADAGVDFDGEAGVSGNVEILAGGVGGGGVCAV